jgi:hypothetical protein
LYRPFRIPALLGILSNFFSMALGPHPPYFAS